MDPKNATQIERVDLLEIQNINLRAQLLEQERQAAVKALNDKYGAFQSITNDGNIVRAPVPLASVPAEGA